MAIAQIFNFPSHSPGQLGTQIQFTAWAFDSIVPVPATLYPPEWNENGRLRSPVRVDGTEQILPNGLIFSADPGLYQTPPVITFTPSVTVFSWNSTNGSVATINSAGLLTLVGLGSTVISATANAITANSTVTVTSLTAPIAWTCAYGTRPAGGPYLFRWSGSQQFLPN